MARETGAGENRDHDRARRDRRAEAQTREPAACRQPENPERRQQIREGAERPEPRRGGSQREEHDRDDLRRRAHARPRQRRGEQRAVTGRDTNDP